jgi:hypothetical protein
MFFVYYLSSYKLLLFALLCSLCSQAKVSFKPVSGTGVFVGENLCEFTVLGKPRMTQYYNTSLDIIDGLVNSKGNYVANKKLNDELSRIGLEYNKRKNEIDKRYKDKKRQLDKLYRKYSTGKTDLVHSDRDVQAVMTRMYAYENHYAKELADLNIDMGKKTRKALDRADKNEVSEADLDKTEVLEKIGFHNLTTAYIQTIKATHVSNICHNSIIAKLDKSFSPAVEKSLLKSQMSLPPRYANYDKVGFEYAPELELFKGSSRIQALKQGKELSEDKSTKDLMPGRGDSKETISVLAAGQGGAFEFINSFEKAAKSYDQIFASIDQNILPKLNSLELTFAKNSMEKNAVYWHRYKKFVQKKCKRLHMLDKSKHNYDDQGLFELVTCTYFEEAYPIFFD